MRKNQIEAWALDVIARAQKGDPVEDSRVELKSNFLPAAKAARRLAGHANAARGEAILWIVGIGDRGSVDGIEHHKFADWFDQVQNCFDGPAPALTDLNLSLEGKTIAALCFETDRAPYVVKNAEGGGATADVPWREATRIRSARRSELLSMLSEAVQTPSVEILCASVLAQQWADRTHVTATMDLYFSHSGHRPLVLPNHLVKISAHSQSNNENLEFATCCFSHDFSSPTSLWLDPSKTEPHYNHRMAEATAGEAIFKGPGKMRLSGVFDALRDTLFTSASFRLETRLGIAGDDRAIALSCPVARITLAEDTLRQEWRWRS